MCRPPSWTETPDNRTEREKLDEALRRTEALNRTWCEDGKIILAAARQHLATLPLKPLEVWHICYAERSASPIQTPWQPKVEVRHSRYDADAWAKILLDLPEKYRHVTVTGPHKQSVPA